MGETVNITFSNITSPRSGRDWVGVWSPRPIDGNYSSRAPSKYKYVKADVHGSGHVAMWLLNMRDSVVVAYFTGGLDNPVMLAESQPVHFESTTMPMHIHLALTGDATEMKIDWTSATADRAQVRWGDRANNLINVVKVRNRNKDEED